MKKSLMSNIKHFVDSNVRQRIDRVANNNNEFFGDDLLLVERQFEDLRHVCAEAEKRISSLLQSSNSSPLNAYTQNVQASLNNLSSLTGSNVTTTTTTAASSPQPQQMVGLTEATVVSSLKSKSNNTFQAHIPLNEPSSLSNNNYNQVQANSNLVFNDTTQANSVPLELGDDIRRHKKLPIVGFLKFLVKSCHKLKPDSLLATTLTHCSLLQTQITHLYLTYEQTIESQCLKPIQQLLEVDVPNVIKLRKLFIKSHNDLESLKAKYNGASQKQLQQQLQTNHFTSTSYTITQSSTQQASANKLDQLKKELDEAVTKFEQARDTYATELYAFVCRETELVNLFVKFYKYQAEYQQQVGQTIQSSLPTLSNTLFNTPRKVVFGTHLEEHLRSTGRSTSLVIELCVHMLCTNALSEEGLFRISGSLVKIKKLKNAINAWFVTLANQSELVDNSNNDQQQQVKACLSGSQASKLAIYNLFKGIVGQRPQQTTTTSLVGGDIINNQSTAPAVSTATRDDSTLTYNCNQSSTAQSEDHNQHQLVFDAHTVAGLLKLYLRELPEPLFTHALYDQWLDATVKTLNNEQEGALEQVVQILPKVNYDNLRLLIRFLRLLTTYSETNKMTATNLAIAIAPSLIWAQQPSILNHQQSSPEQQHQQQQLINGVEVNVQDDMSALNMQMSSIGISASLHALVIENLINRADELFPGEVNFIINDLETVDSSSLLHEKCLPQHGASSSKSRIIKSTSPTGLSTASSSSFSSNTSATSSEVKRNRKGGSIEGMLNDLSGIAKSTSNRPVSVHIQRESNQNHQLNPTPPPPPIPPAPLSRSHSRQASDSSTCLVRSVPSHNKPPAPPVPPPCTLKRQRNLKASATDHTTGDTLTNSQNDTTNSSNNGSNSNPKPIPSAFTGSLRGTGSIPPSTSHNLTGPNTVRPNVPPPSRPLKTLSAREEVDNAVPIPKIRSEVNDSNHPQSDSKSSHSLASSGGNLRAEFEEINTVDIEDMDNSAPISPVVSLDSLTGDSSFDNDESSPSLEHSWTECDIEQNQNNNQSSNSVLSSSIDTQLINEDQYQKQHSTMKPLPRLLKKRENQQIQSEDFVENLASPGCDRSESSSLVAPPIKPPRSSSPKITQSTPL